MRTSICKSSRLHVGKVTLAAGGREDAIVEKISVSSSPENSSHQRLRDRYLHHSLPREVEFGIAHVRRRRLGFAVWQVE